MHIRRTKIVCTIGPASESPAMLKKLIRAGMNVARLNFSHGTHANHCQLFERIHAASQVVGKPVAILQDLQGPRIRLGEIAKEGIQVKKGEQVRLVYGSTLSETERGGVRSIPLAYPLYRFVKKGNILLVDDGKLAFRVERVNGKDILARVVSPGLVKTHKGVN
ncbi:pyruvate kinase, partial [Candidatus Uhrbacteria bacterium]|nr:pyruvate kinase [Candidatus Uhrbacteria bacterium]